MNTERLLKLADFLDTVPRKAFNLDSWQTKPPTKAEGEKEGGCGFAGCAVGWAVHAKLFRGLKFVPSIYDPPNPHIGYYGARDWSAVEKLFNADDRDDVLHLFSIDNYPEPPTPKQVAKKIRAFVKATSSPPSGASLRA